MGVWEEKIGVWGNRETMERMERMGKCGGPGPDQHH